MSQQIEEISSDEEQFLDYITKCCDECLSYGFHESSCSRNPNGPLMFDGMDSFPSHTGGDHPENNVL